MISGHKDNYTEDHTQRYQRLKRKSPKTLNFADNLFVIRMDAGLSQSRLADRAGYDHSYISRLESDTRNPTPQAVEHLARIIKLYNPSIDTDPLFYSMGFLIPGSKDLKQCHELTQALEQIIERKDDIAAMVCNSIEDLLSAALEANDTTYQRSYTEAYKPF